MRDAIVDEGIDEVEIVDEQLACESSTMYATSSAFRWVFTSTTDPCNFATAAHTSKKATEFGSMIATRSPGTTPRAARPRAIRSVRASKST